MAEKVEDDPDILRIETRFQRLARRPGGIPREKAIRTAQVALDLLESDFQEWLDEKLMELVAATGPARLAAPADPAWVDTAYRHSRALRDVGATMGFELVGFIANNLCEIFEAGAPEDEQRLAAIECHVKALLLARQAPYRQLSPGDIPELVDGLRRVVAATSSLQPVDAAAASE